MFKASFNFLFVFTLLLFLTACPKTQQVKNAHHVVAKTAEKASKTASAKQSSSSSSKKSEKSEKWKLVKGEKATDFTLKDLRGRSRSLSDDKGKVILLSFWATWCSPCLKEMPHLQELYNRYKDKGFQLLAINTDSGSSVAQVGPTISRYNYTFTVLLDTEGRIANIFNPKGFNPFTVLIDKKGYIRVTHTGYNAGDEKNLEKHILALLKE